MKVKFLREGKRALVCTFSLNSFTNFGTNKKIFMVFLTLKCDKSEKFPTFSLLLNTYSVDFFRSKHVIKISQACVLRRDNELRCVKFLIYDKDNVFEIKTKTFFLENHNFILCWLILMGHCWNRSKVLQTLIACTILTFWNPSHEAQNFHCSSLYKLAIE
jgi:hypothetical protein